MATGNVGDGSAARLRPAFDFVRRQVADGLVPTAVLGVADAHGTIGIEAFGSHAGRPVPEDAAYLLASITKPILATAVMRLVADGRLVLGLPVAHYLPEFTPPSAAESLPGGDAVTTWHLLTHTAGLADEGFVHAGVWPDELPPGVVRGGARPDRRELYRRACTRPLLFAPGSQYAYCSDSFYVLGELIHRLTGVDYPEYLARHVFGPLGMTRTGFDPELLPGADEPGATIAPRIADGEHDRIGPMTRYFVSLTFPGAGLWSTVPDLLRFGRAMLNGGILDGARVLSRPFVDLMTRDATAGIRDSGTPPQDPHYALGWQAFGPNFGTPVSARAYWHGGATGTRLLIDPEAGLAIVYLTNNGWNAAGEPAQAAIQAVYATLD